MTFFIRLRHRHRRSLPLMSFVSGEECITQLNQLSTCPTLFHYRYIFVTPARDALVPYTHVPLTLGQANAILATHSSLLLTNKRNYCCLVYILSCPCTIPFLLSTNFLSQTFLLHVFFSKIHVALIFHTSPFDYFFVFLASFIFQVLLFLLL